jgi:hypothetical protein
MHNVQRWQYVNHYFMWPLLGPFVEMGDEWTPGDVRPSIEPVYRLRSVGRLCAAAAGGMSSIQATDRAKVYVGVVKKVMKRLGKNFSATTPWFRQQAKDLWAHFDEILAEMLAVFREGLDWCGPCSASAVVSSIQTLVSSI